MKKEFVPYELAVELKELGFNEPCLACYLDGIFVVKLQSTNHEFEYFNNTIFSFNGKSFSAPLFQQAFRWFLEKYNLVHTIYSNASGYVWELHYNKERGGTHICDSGERGDCELSGMFTTYEKSEIECLKKLIEIVKKTLTNPRPNH